MVRKSSSYRVAVPSSPNRASHYGQQQIQQSPSQSQQQSQLQRQHSNARAAPNAPPTANVAANLADAAGPASPSTPHLRARSGGVSGGGPQPRREPLCVVPHSHRLHGPTLRLRPPAPRFDLLDQQYDVALALGGGGPAGPGGLPLGQGAAGGGASNGRRGYHYSQQGVSIGVGLGLAAGSIGRAGSGLAYRAPIGMPSSPVGTRGGGGGGLGLGIGSSRVLGGSFMSLRSDASLCNAASEAAAPANGDDDDEDDGGEGPEVPSVVGDMSGAADALPSAGRNDKPEAVDVKEKREGAPLAPEPEPQPQQQQQSANVRLPTPTMATVTSRTSPSLFNAPPSPAGSAAAMAPLPAGALTLMGVGSHAPPATGGAGAPAMAPNTTATTATNTTALMSVGAAAGRCGTGSGSIDAALTKALDAVPVVSSSSSNPTTALSNGTGGHPYAATLLSSISPTPSPSASPQRPPSQAQARASASAAALLSVIGAASGGVVPPLMPFVGATASSSAGAVMGGMVTAPSRNGAAASFVELGSGDSDLQQQQQQRVHVQSAMGGAGASAMHQRQSSIAADAYGSSIGAVSTPSTTTGPSASSMGPISNAALATPQSRSPQQSHRTSAIPSTSAHPHVQQQPTGGDVSDGSALFPSGLLASIRRPSSSGALRPNQTLVQSTSQPAPSTIVHPSSPIRSASDVHGHGHAVSVDGLEEAGATVGSPAAVTSAALSAITSTSTANLSGTPHTDAIVTAEAGAYPPMPTFLTATGQRQFAQLESRLHNPLHRSRDEGE